VTTPVRPRRLRVPDDAGQRRARRARIAELANVQDGVISRRQLYAAGLTRWQITAELRAARWRAHGRQTIAVHTGELIGRAPYWRAAFEAGPRAAIDGVSALCLAGLQGWETIAIRVSVPRGARVPRLRDAVVRQTRRLRADDVVPVGVPRVRVDVAAIRAALWATSDRQAATLLAMTVQQRLATAEAVGAALLQVRRDKRRRLLEAIVLDLLGGAHSMGEIDFARECRRRGLPAPTRQVVRKTATGKVYLDVRWDDFRVVVEVDGAQHLLVEQHIPDALRQNRVAIAGDTVLRLPVLGLRVAPDEFFAQIAAALTAAGWSAAA
jgi:very-short-patch-repair endonuclease